MLLFPHRSNRGMTVIALKINEMDSQIKSLLTVVWHSVFVFVFLICASVFMAGQR